MKLCRDVSVSACWGAMRTDCRLWFKQQKCVSHSSGSWKPKSGLWAGRFLPRLGEAVFPMLVALRSLACLGLEKHHPSLCLSCHMVFSPCVSTSEIPSSLRTQSYWIRTYPKDFILTCSPL